MVFQLDDRLVFPDPHYGEPDGLLAVGGDLSVDRLLLAYSNGIFPWYSFRDCEEIHWYCPMRRFVIFPNEIHISHSMRTLINRGQYLVSINNDFEGVIRQCSQLRINEMGAWLGEDMIRAYTGGLYGVNLGGAFFGESMFSLVPNASKLALISLAQFLEKNGGVLIDCQLETPHLRSMGGRFISYEDYMEILRNQAFK